jgi:hypothetical protein
MVNPIGSYFTLLNCTFHFSVIFTLSSSSDKLDNNDWNIAKMNDDK